jgi:transcriptional regulator with XRE-family HTH domain
MRENINSEALKRFRREKSWSQEKLANAAGLSLRTIQRVENTGIASLETKLALSSTLNVSIEQLSNSAFTLSPFSLSQYKARYGYLGVGLGLLFAYSGIVSGVFLSNVSYGDAGVWLGAVGAFIGLSFGFIGVVAKRAKSNT